METTETIDTSGYCPYCSNNSVKVYHQGKCPRIKSIEYHNNGTIKKVEFNECFEPLIRRNYDRQEEIITKTCTVCGKNVLGSKNKIKHSPDCPHKED